MDILSSLRSTARIVSRFVDERSPVVTEIGSDGLDLNRYLLYSLRVDILVTF